MERHNDPAPQIPASTYRLQFNRHFRFSDAEEIVAYLHELGISAVYASPYLKANKDSLHGYDIVDPTMLNPEVGTEEEYDAFVQELRRHGMGQILDIVPNHMAWGSDNAWWMDVLENGPSSPFAKFFSIDWHHRANKLAGKLLVPFLGEPYGKTLESGELQLLFREGTFSVRYYDLRLPLAPESYVLILEHRLEDLRHRLSDTDPDLAEFLSVIRELTGLPPAAERNETRIGERYREKESTQKRLLALVLKNSAIKNFLEENIKIFNGSAGKPESFNLLDLLLSKQVWRLAHWHVAREEINYRRFFDISNLAALRSEDPAVFHQTHRLIFRLVSERKVTGFRIDHPDGLHNPEEYLEWLQRCCFSLLATETPDDGVGEPRAGEPAVSQRHAGLLSENPRYKPFYIVTEKILTGDEELPREWQTFGTTGYDFLNLLNGIFVAGSNALSFSNIYKNFTGAPDDFSAVIYKKKKLIMQAVMAGEINNLGYLLGNIAGKLRQSRDFTPQELTRTLTGIIASFPVYRSYIHSRPVRPRDLAYIEAAVEQAKKRNPSINAALFDFIRDILLLRLPDGLTASDQREWLDFVMRFQQTTAPVMAKGVEDTAFYVYNRLLSLNEVGGAPDRFGMAVEEFHDRNRERLQSWPQALSATSTHDTKRSEDVRARINVLSEIPRIWEKCLLKWGRLNGPQKGFWQGRRVPDGNEEYLLYQTLIGAWPLGQPGDSEFAGFRKRIQDYMVKALREAKVHSSWIKPDRDYERAVTSFIEAILTISPANEFLRDFVPFQKTISFYGMLNSLSQLLLKIASPGVPDFFQGTELWDFSLVDPDNRRPVNFALRRELLDGLNKEKANCGPDLHPFLEQLMAGPEAGAIKLYITRQALHFRRQNHALFVGGAYIPLTCEGKLQDHICAFARQESEKAVLVAAPRLMASVGRLTVGWTAVSQLWEKTALVLPAELPGLVFKNVLTEERIAAVDAPGKRLLPAAALFSIFPVAMIESLPEEGEVAA